MPRLHCDSYVGRQTTIPIKNTLVVFDTSGTTIDDIDNADLIHALQSHNPSIQPVKSIVVEVEDSSVLTEQANANALLRTLHKNTLKTRIGHGDEERTEPEVIASTQKSEPLFVSPAKSQQESWLEKARALFPGATDQELLEGRATFVEKREDGILSLEVAIVEPEEKDKEEVEEPPAQEESVESPWETLPVAEKTEKVERIFSVAKRAGCKTKDFLAKLSSLGYNYKSAQNTVREGDNADEMIKAVEDFDVKQSKRKAPTPEA